MNKFLFVLLVFLFPMVVSATHVAVLETVAAKESQVSVQECRYMTDELRNAALKVLPAEQNYTIMTRENISVMLPPGTKIEDCEGECLAETGRKIAADYVVQAHIAVFGGQLSLTAELYATASGKLVGSFTGRGDNVNALLQLIQEQSYEFFKKIKQNVSGFGGGFGFIQDYSAFAVDKKKSFVINVVTEPAGAALSIDGRPISKCTSTPCKIQVEEGEHRFLVVKDRYEDGGAAVIVSENDQKVILKLSPAFGFLKLDPAYPDLMGNDRELEMRVDDSIVSRNEMELGLGMHKVRIDHSCYDPMEFEAMIVKDQHYVFNGALTRGVSGLSLNVEKDGEPAIVSVYVDGVEVGQTPFVGTVPLCSKISVGDSSRQEVLSIPLAWHETIEYKHEMKSEPIVLVSAPIEEDDVEEELVQVKEEFKNASAEKESENPVPEQPQNSLGTWNFGVLAALSYNDLWGSFLGLDEIAGDYDGYSIKTSNAKDLMQNYWALGFNIGLSILFAPHPYWGGHVEVDGALRRGRGRTNMGVSLTWHDISLPEEYDDVKIDFFETQWNVDIPVLVRFTIPNLVYLEAGPMVSFCLHSNSEIDIESNWGDYTYKNKNFASATELGLMFALGVTKQVGMKTMDVSLRLMTGLTSLYDEDDSPKTFQMQFNVAFWLF
ncbi:PEGA domain-containing protein [Fibrobacter sp. UWEL]|uniref:PEGA domain-containing protein n=1 Tax=Fibrobacter sp. UWEL TaxID=1896209 RepID=UPI0009243DA3|nr:PEGA domain-containing protein [Fibrobacter sp. UWEL]SHL35722.1 PEGA domain-containing protein [Fibrobacter sp. UWEL]